MKYRKISIETTTKAVDYISAMSDELGLCGIQIEDKVPLTKEEKESMFIDILPELGEDDGTAIVSSYVEMDTDIKGLVEGIKNALLELSEFVDIGKGEVTVSVTDDEDWLNNWKEFFKPFRVMENIVIKPTWEELTEKKDGDLVVEIDPGTAFGTGSHETTRLCMEALWELIGKGDKEQQESLEKNIFPISPMRDGTLCAPQKMSVLDVGCGSGILSILALKLGAKRVRAVDVDENAIAITWENLKINGIEKEKADFDAYIGDIINDVNLQDELGKESYDIVVANILADIIIPLSGSIGKNLKTGGIFVSSGILNTRQEDVTNALISNGFEIERIVPMNDWVSVWASKR